MSDIIGVDLIELIRTAGYAGLFAIVFLESGIPVGFFLPGDSLLFTAGILASADFFNIFILAGLVSIAAILGDSAGYWLGARFGRQLFEKEKALFLSKKNLARTEKFYERYGVRAIILARFVPVVRTFTPIFAGVAQMRYSTFLTYNIIGALLWGAGLTVLGFSLGSLIPDIEKYLHYIVIVIIILSALPIVFEVLKARKEAHASK
jgi:membrane-associated protein